MSDCGCCCQWENDAYYLREEVQRLWAEIVELKAAIACLVGEEEDL